MFTPCNPYIAACRSSRTKCSPPTADEDEDEGEDEAVGADVGVWGCHSRYTTTLRPSG